MENKKIIYFCLIVLFFTALILGMIVFFSKEQQELKVSFLNVGQGDAILIQNGNKQILIDSGKNGKLILEKLGEKMPFWDRKIELVIITHPDFDHYGGFGEVFKSYKVEGVVKTQARSDGEEWIDLESKIKNEKSKLIDATPRTKVVFPNQAKLEIIYPLSEIEAGIKDRNDASVVSRLVFGENEFLFTGDLSLEGEEEVINNLDVNIGADFLKVGHHGSRSSSGGSFLDKVKPKEAVISVGKNSYGHPHREVIERLSERGIKIWQTDKNGDIDYRCLNINEMCKIWR